MGCSDAWEVNLTLEEIAEETKRDAKRKSIIERLNKVSLADLTVADLRTLIHLFGHKPFSFGMHDGEYNTMESILQQVANRKGRKR